MKDFKTAFKHITKTINAYKVILDLYKIEDVEDVSFETQLWIKGHNMEMARAVQQLLNASRDIPTNVENSLKYLKVAFEQSQNAAPHPVLVSSLTALIEKISKCIREKYD